MDLIQIEWTAPSEEEAISITSFLLEQKLIACANIFRVNSFFIWKGQQEQSFEMNVKMKSNQASFDKIEKIILEKGSYEIPALIAYQITHAHKEYSKWVRESLS